MKWQPRITRIRAGFGSWLVYMCNNNFTLRQSWRSIGALLVIVLMIASVLSSSREAAANYYSPAQMSHTIQNFSQANFPIISLERETRPIIAVRVHFHDRNTVDEIASWTEPWAVDYEKGVLLLGVTSEELERLANNGFEITIDEDLTSQINRQLQLLPGQSSGIPGYPCYRTIAETYQSAAALADQYPGLVSWIDVGDSWEKTMPGGKPGYDMQILKITNSAVPGPKPKLFVLASIHAREYTPAELVLRFGEFLAANYNVNPDVTWLLDYQEILLMPLGNPDGREYAQAGYSWRKNTNSNYCPAFAPGADINRNFSFLWNCCGGSSDDECSEVYHGTTAASEPETQSITNLIESEFPDLRADDLNASAPITSTGIFLDVHSYGRQVMWPWGFTNTTAPNGAALQTLGRKLTFYNQYQAMPAIGLYPTDGTAQDFAYGNLGLAAFTLEIGGSFFEDCPGFESEIYPDNLAALLYTAKASQLPYLVPSGPDALDVTIAHYSNSPGGEISLSAQMDDTRYGDPSEDFQQIAAAEYYLDAPPWATDQSPIPFPMSASDGSFDSPIEAVEAVFNSNALSPGRHMVFVRGKDASGVWGAVTAQFIYTWDDIFLPLVNK